LRHKPLGCKKHHVVESQNTVIWDYVVPKLVWLSQTFAPKVPSN
jgi:hypothetical protein